ANNRPSSAPVVAGIGDAGYSSTSFLGRALTEELRNIEVYEISVMKDDRFDRTLHLVALMTVGGDDVHDFAGNAVLVGERDAAKRMSHLLPKFSLNYFAGGILVVLEWLADVGQQRAGNEIVTLNGNAAPKRFFQHVGDRNALPRAGIEMLDELHVDFASQERELDRAKFGKGPALPAAAGGNRFVPHRCYLFAQ